MSTSRKKDPLQKPSSTVTDRGVSTHPAHRWANTQRPAGASVKSGIRSESPGLPDGSVADTDDSGEGM